MVNSSFQQASPHQWSAEEEEMKYGPFSDGEADTLKKGRLDRNDQILGQIVTSPGNRSCRKSTRGRGSNGLITPHYATMSRVAQANNSRQSSVDQESCGSGGLKYTSQPQLNSHLLSDFIGQRAVAHFPANSEALTPLSLKTSITFPRKLPPPNSTAQQQRYPAEKQNWNSGKNGRIALHQGDRLRQLEGHPSSQNSQAQPYPDLARRPLSYSQVPPPPNKRTTPLRYSMMHNPTIQYSGGAPMTRSLVQQPIQTSSDDNPHEYEHSRSSSVGDIPVGMTNGQNTERMATPDGYASLPYDSTLPTTSRPLARERRKSARSGAVRVDLSFADKSIRRPGSAPDLVNNDEACTSQHSPGGNSVRSAKKIGGGLIDRGRSTSSERETLLKKMGGPGTPGTRKVVAFAGIDDDDDESDTESEDQPTVNSFDEEVWVKQPDSSKGNESVATTGVIIAGGQNGNKVPQQTNLSNGSVAR